MDGHVLSDCLDVELGVICDTNSAVRFESRIEYFKLQRILIIKISNYKWSKKDVRNYIIPHYNLQTH